MVLLGRSLQWHPSYLICYRHRAGGTGLRKEKPSARHFYTMETIETIVKKFQPHGCTLLCKPIESAEKSKGGIIIPEQARNPLNQGVILSIGDQLSDEDWRVGQVVMWTQHAESKLRIDDIQLILVTVDSILLKSTPENSKEV